MNAVKNISLTEEQITDFCRRRHIQRLAVFGSAVRDDFAPDSDIDVLYEFEAGRTPGWDIVDVIDELSALLGRKVDFVPFQYLNRHIRDQVLADAVVIYGPA